MLTLARCHAHHLTVTHGDADPRCHAHHFGRPSLSCPLPGGSLLRALLLPLALCQRAKKLRAHLLPLAPCQRAKKLRAHLLPLAPCQRAKKGPKSYGHIYSLSPLAKGLLWRETWVKSVLITPTHAQNYSTDNLKIVRSLSM